jgi:hypothetical protein
VEQGWIEWSYMPASLVTWEPLEQLCQQLPRAPAWGQATSKEWGNVSTRAALLVLEDGVPEDTTEASQEQAVRPSEA